MHPQQIRRPLRTPAIAVAITIASCIAVLPAALAFTFQIVFDEESLTCPGREAINMSSFLDLSGVTFSRDSDNGMVLNGKAVWQVDTKPNDRLSVRSEYLDEMLGRGFVSCLLVFCSQFKVDCMHNDRGVFKSSPFVYVMHSFCPEEFNPKRAWYNMTRSFTTAEQRKCPPPKGVSVGRQDGNGSLILASECVLADGAGSDRCAHCATLHDSDAHEGGRIRVQHRGAGQRAAGVLFRVQRRRASVVIELGFNLTVCSFEIHKVWLHANDWRVN